MGCDVTRLYLTFHLQFDPLVGGRPSIMVRLEITHFPRAVTDNIFQGRPSMAPYKAGMEGTEEGEEETASGDLIAMNR